MNKKIFGIRLGTLISLVVCLVVAFLIWLYANYTAMIDTPLQDGVVSLLPRG
ncbi:MAG: hypothetical protein IJW38_04315 [Clostridia bacterium]|nr:hypothetical protein [Clostridia bacterium]